ncbi:hypothetical protein PC111_g18471 [Phytophthora cactorum]|nr:hypothetical protein PC111_g18471 [Phytophthora cactorum]KAG3058282.1 hypothetical protein PC122_g20743 [Phytophthora cactorum]
MLFGHNLSRNLCTCKRTANLYGHPEFMLTNVPTQKTTAGGFIFASPLQGGKMIKDGKMIKSTLTAFARLYGSRCSD